MACLLLIDDEESIAICLRTFFEIKGHDFMSAALGEEGLKTALRELPDIVLLDLHLPDMHGMTILKELKTAHPDIVVIVLTGYGEVKEAVEAMKLGAEHYFQKPVDLEELSVIVEKNLGLRQLRQQAQICRKSPYDIIGRSKQTLGLIRMISLMADNPSTTVLIEGETGTGKELVARNIHLQGARSDKPFVDINCASIPEQIFESELFGYEAGAFTDAKTTKKGLFEVADGGTLFLDEVSEMSVPLQAKLLRVLEAKSFRRIGGTRDIRIDVRVIAATNRNLAESVAKGAFREDLYYRLNVMPIKLPSLRERIEDIPLLAEFFLAENARRSNESAKRLDREAVDSLCAYSWPGNIRELRNVIERAVILSHGEVITAKDLTLFSVHSREERNPLLSLLDVERQHIRKVLGAVDSNMTRAAQILGISRSTLNEKVKRYGISPE